MAPPNIAWTVGNVLAVGDGVPCEDASSGGILAPDSVDYVFGRVLYLGITDWTRCFSVMSRPLRPGALIEHQHLD